MNSLQWACDVASWQGVPFGQLLVSKALHRSRGLGCWRTQVLKEVLHYINSAPRRNWAASFFLCGEAQDKCSLLLTHEPPLFICQCLTTSLPQGFFLHCTSPKKPGGRVMEPRCFQGQSVRVSWVPKGLYHSFFWGYIKTKQISVMFFTSHPYKHPASHIVTHGHHNWKVGNRWSVKVLIYSVLVEFSRSFPLLMLSHSDLGWGVMGRRIRGRNEEGKKLTGMRWC